MLKSIITAILVLFFMVGTAFAAININTANKAELQNLRGIGPSKAAAIIEYRERVGKFKSVDDLVKVRGIGAETLNRLRGDITVGN